MPKGRKLTPAPKAAKGAAAPPRRPLLSPGGRRVVAHLLAVAVVVAAAGGGLYYLKAHVRRTVAFPQDPPAVVLKNRPAWMGDFLYDQITRSVRPSRSHSAFDHQLLVDTVEQLRRNPWVSDVRTAKRVYGKRPGDTLEIDCDFRAPIALVKWADHYWLVDVTGVKLPEQYAGADVPKVVVSPDGQTVIRIIEGVSTPPPDAGQRWRGDDLAAGIDLIKLLYDQPYAQDVIKVNVANFQGRNDPRESQLVLVTRHATEVRWGRPINATDFFIEVPTGRKLEYLQTVYARFGRLDAGRPWIDIRFDNITYPSPDASAAPAPTAIANGR